MFYSSLLSPYLKWFLGVTLKSWFRRNRFSRVTPAKFIRYLKSFYKANLAINKPLRLWVLIWTLLSSKTFESTSTIILHIKTFIKQFQKMGLTQKTRKKRSNEKKTRYFFLKLINKKSSPWYNNSITKNQKNQRRWYKWVTKLPIKIITWINYKYQWI